MKRDGPSGCRCWSTVLSICIHPVELKHTARSDSGLVSGLGGPGPSPHPPAATRPRRGGNAARKKRLSGCNPRVEILTWLLPLTTVMTALARRATRKPAMAHVVTPPLHVHPSGWSLPVNPRAPAHEDVLPRPNGFEPLQADLHGTSGTHGEYNHGQV